MSPHPAAPPHRAGPLLTVLALALAGASALGGPLQAAPGPAPASTGDPMGSAVDDLRISQVYGGGGNTSAPLKCDFVELHNNGALALSLAGMSVQYVSATGTGTWNATSIEGTLAPGAYYLVQLACGDNGVDLPTPDQTGSTNMATSAGKVALVNSTTALTGHGLGHESVIDFVGYGTTPNACEGSPPGACDTKAPAPSNTLAIHRADNGCTDTDNNESDFATGAPNPRNSASTPYSCGGEVTTPTPTVPPPTATDPPPSPTGPPPTPTSPPSPTAGPTDTPVPTATPTPASEADSDADGVPDALEDGAPNGGDGNGDGLPDRLQAHVASLPNAVNGDYLTLAAPEGMVLSQVTAAGNPAPGDPAILGVSFPVGLLGFELAPMPAPPAAVSLSLILANAVASSQYWRHGPEPGDPADHWYRFDPLSGSPPTGATYVSPTHWALSFVDGARGDDDLTVNGILVDQGGPGQTGSTPVQLTDFSARRSGRPVHVSWTTASEVKHAGFRLWRETEAGVMEGVGPALIPARGGELNGASYRVLDLTAPKAGLRYWLDALSTTGATTRYGPAIAGPFRGQAIELPPRPGPVIPLAGASAEVQ